jgi:hypothetical protein
MIQDVAQAVADALNDGAFAGEFTAARTALPVFDLRDLGTLTVSVVPRKQEISPLDRASDRHDVQVDVAVAKKVEATDNNTIDALLDLVQRIMDHLNRRNLEESATPSATRALGGQYLWRRVQNAPVYSPDHLREKRLFISVITLTYSVMRRPR